MWGEGGGYFFIECIHSCSVYIVKKNMNSKGFDRYNIYRGVLFKGFSRAFK